MPETETLHKERILLVDDIPANIDYLAESLKEKYQLTIALNGAEAIRCANSREKPDLVLLDVMMPGMDGYTVCRSLKNDSNTRDIPIIFVTARDTLDDELVGLQCGAVDFLTKPVNVPTVEAKITTQLELKKNRECLAKQATELEALNQKLYSEIEERRVTETVLLRRDAVLDAVSFAAEQLALLENWHEVIPELVSRLGKSADVSRAYICQDFPGLTDLQMPSNCYLWSSLSDDVTSGCNLCHKCQSRCGKLKAYYNAFSAGQQIIGPAKSLPVDIQKVLSADGVRSTAIRPIMVEKKLWGFLGVDECSVERIWSSPEIDALNTAAHIIGAAIYRRQVEAKLKRAKDAAEMASQIKTQFLATMSHEIRTPMNAVIGMTGLVLKTRLDTKQRHCMAIVNNSANTLLGLLNDILDFSKIEAGQMELENRPFRLRNTMETAMNTLLYKAQQKGLGLKLIIPPTILDCFLGDELRLRQVILNLISNAVKFTENGSVVIRVRLRKKRKNDVLLLFTVADTGIGIPSEKQEAIFNSFNQADSSVSRIYGGTGLGLSISRKLTKMMGGEIWLESEVGRGSSFHFTARFGLPALTTKIQARKSVSDEKISPLISAGLIEGDGKPHVSSVRRKSTDFRLLVVEDDFANQELARLFLEEAGYKVNLASNGIEALHCLSQEKFDLVLLDMQMPKMDGLATSRYIRACEQEHCQAINDDGKLAAKLTAKLSGKHLPIIAMTANAMGSDHEKCLAAGMDEYLTKPIHPDLVFSVLDNILGQCERKVGFNDWDGLAEKQGEHSRLKEVRRYLIDNLGLDPHKIPQLLDAFGETYKTSLSSMRKAQEMRDFNLLCRAAHTIKGGVLNLGLHDIAVLVRRIENDSKNAFEVDYESMIKQLEDSLDFLLN